MSERGRRGRRAQSIVELAILLPLFLILIAGLTEIGFAIAAYLSLQDAVREAASLRR
jgi:Flp pilus assembly protein TadG